MGSDHHPTREDQPEQRLSGAVTLVLTVWCVFAVLSPLALDRLNAFVAARTQSAFVATAQSLALRQIVDGLHTAAEAPDLAARAQATEAVRTDLDRLVGLQAQKARLSPRETAATALLADAVARAGALLAESPLPGALRQQRDIFDTQVTALVDRDAMVDELLVSEARLHARIATFALFALHLAAAGTLLVTVVRPARHALQHWISERREAGREDRFRMLHDPLTRMPNALYLQAHLARVAAGADRATTQTAVFRIDLDKFRGLRETLGIRATDEILRITARRIKQSLRAGDFAAHLGGDDFVVIASDLPDAKSVSRIAQRLQSALAMPFSLHTGARRLSASIGVTLISDDEPEPDRILGNADIALEEAREAGPGNVHYFRKSLRAEAEQRESFYAELVSGMTRGEFFPFFQPQIDLATGEVAGFEALVRWRHPKRGLLTPAAFLDFAETAELTERIGEIVLTQSIAALTAWDAAGLSVPKIGVNFALGQLRDPRLIEKIKWEIERNDIEPSRIAIEVLETIMIKSDADLVVRNLRGLASAGFQIDLDDFGTGHASIQNLRRFMVNRIKIDRSFIFGMETSEESRSLTTSMIAMAKALGIRILAEGVETEAACTLLRDMGCDYAQGYLIARPMPLADTFAWLAARQSGPAAALAGDPNTA